MSSNERVHCQLQTLGTGGNIFYRCSANQLSLTAQMWRTYGIGRRGILYLYPFSISSTVQPFILEAKTTLNYVLPWRCFATRMNPGRRCIRPSPQGQGSAPSHTLLQRGCYLLIFIFIFLFFKAKRHIKSRSDPHSTGKDDVSCWKKKGGENVGVGVNCVCVRVYPLQLVISLHKPGAL
jgi:hypothetical protein